MRETESQDLDALYKHLRSVAQESPLACLDESLHPRPRDAIYDLAAGLRPGAGTRVLDLGCGTGTHSCALARRFDCRVVGLDPVEHNLFRARTRALLEDLLGQVTFVQGSMEAMPFEDRSFDLIWCRDMLSHVRGLVAGTRECARVLRPGGRIILIAFHQTDLMEPREAARLYAPLEIVPESMSRTNIERAFKEAGLQVVAAETIGSELMEYYEEHDGRASRELMRIARLLRARERFATQLGKSVYDIALALYHWHIYQLLGKLSMTIDVLEHSSDGAEATIKERPAFDGQPAG